MTLVPELRPVKGLPGKPAALPNQCSVPGCTEHARDGHHIYPRSFLRGEPYDWIELPDGSVWSNRVGLCGPHHRDVTGGYGPGGGHGAKIEHHKGQWYWIILVRGGVVHWKGPLDPQPYLPSDEDAPVPEEHAANHGEHRPLHEGETCSECGYTKPATRTPGPKRAAVSWGVTVPRDAELGAEILDGWVEDFGALFGFDLKGGKGLLRYHVLTVILAWAAQNQTQLINDLKEAGGT